MQGLVVRGVNQLLMWLISSIRMVFNSKLLAGLYLKIAGLKEKSGEVRRNGIKTLDGEAKN
jgi:hypothetical protein